MSAVTTEERLAYMADQIARNFMATGHDAAIAATADHIAHFWDPRMKALAFAMLDARPAYLTDAAAAALAMLRDQGAPPPQTKATVFAAPHEAGRADAG